MAITIPETDIGSEDVVAIYDADGNKVVYKDKDQYSFAELDQMVTNRYTFTVTEQDMHIDGNYSQLITSNGHAEDADPAYDNSNFPYKKYYRLMGVLNNSVKGKIEITKEGEALVGFQKKKTGIPFSPRCLKKSQNSKTQSLASLQPSMKT